MVSCLVCDDHAMMRTALAGAVRMVLGDAEIALADDFPSAWDAASEQQPRLVLCDLVMPGADPVGGIEGVLRAAPEAAVLVVSGNEEDELLLALLNLGVSGFVPKSASGEIVEAAIRLVLAGGRYLPPRMIELAQARGSNDPQRLQGKVQNTISRLTDRQLEVLKLIAEGKSNKQIAREFELSPATVKAHAAAVFAALGASNRVEAVVRANEWGLL